MRQRVDHPMQIAPFSVSDKSRNPAHVYAGRSAFDVRGSALAVRCLAIGAWRFMGCLDGFGLKDKSSRCLSFRPRKLELFR
jgi:hypothetical protein